MTTEASTSPTQKMRLHLPPPSNLGKQVSSTIKLNNDNKKSTSGLSELSKQLRIHQAKNDAQAVEISRLERQLRILADLQGISVTQLRDALEDACQKEAFGEWQSRVAGLRAQLEASHLAKMKDLKQDSAEHQIATLELKVGELEEVQESNQQEIADLYDKLKQESAKVLELQSQLEKEKNNKRDLEGVLSLEKMLTKQLKKVTDEQQAEIDKLQSMSQQQQQQHAQLKSVGVEESRKEIALAFESKYKQRRRQDERVKKEMKASYEKQLEEHREREETLRQEHLKLQIKFDTLSLSTKQLQDAQKQHQLREDQYKARFTVQDERIDDLEQQLISLYAAFTLLKEEAEEQRRRQEEKQADQRHAPPSPFEVAASPHLAGYIRGVASKPISPALKTPKPPPGVARRASYTSSSSSSDSISNTKSPSNKSRKSTGSLNTWQLVGKTPSPAKQIESLPEEECLLKGPLLIRSRNAAWIETQASLYRSTTHFVLSFVGSQMSLNLEPGVSFLERNPHNERSFVININPNQRTRHHVVVAAAQTIEEADLWIDTLNRVLLGNSYNPTTRTGRVQSQHSNVSTASCSTGSGRDEEEELAMALSLSEQDM